MAKIPKQRGGGKTGGSGHGASKFKSIQRGGRPSAGRAKGGCALFLIIGVGVATGLGAWAGQWLAG